MAPIGRERRPRLLHGAAGRGVRRRGVQRHPGAALHVVHPQGGESAPEAALARHDVLAVGRVFRGEVHVGAAAGDVLHLTRREIQHMHVVGALPVGDEHHRFAIGAEARLGVVGEAGSEPHGVAAGDGNQVEVAEHVEDQLLAIGTHVDGEPGAVARVEREAPGGFERQRTGGGAATGGRRCGRLGGRLRAEGEYPEGECPEGECREEGDTKRKGTLAHGVLRTGNGTVAIGRRSRRTGEGGPWRQSQQGGHPAIPDGGKCLPIRPLGCTIVASSRSISSCPPQPFRAPYPKDRQYPPRRAVRCCAPNRDPPVFPPVRTGRVRAAVRRLQERCGCSVHVRGVGQ